METAPPNWLHLPEPFTDGLVGAKIGDLAISTPNAQVIYRPLLDHPASVRLNDDFRFGLHDPMVHPQPFHPSSAHLAVMTAPTQSGLDQLLFLPLFPTDWTPSCQDQAITGLGTLNGDTPGMLIEHGKALLRRLKTAMADAVANPDGAVKLRHLENEKFQTRDLVPQGLPSSSSQSRIL